MVQPLVGFIFYCLLFYIFILFLLCPTFGRWRPQRESLLPTSTDDRIIRPLVGNTSFKVLDLLLSSSSGCLPSSTSNLWLVTSPLRVNESLIRRSESGRWKKTTDEDEEWVPTHSFQALIINFGSRVLTFGEQMLRSDSWFVFDDKVVDESLVTLGRWRPIKPWPPTILTDHILSFSLVFDHQVSSLITNRRLHETWKRRKGGRKGKDMIWRLMVRG